MVIEEIQWVSHFFQKKLGDLLGGEKKNGCVTNF